MEEGLTEPDKEAAQQLVHLSGGNEEEESKGLEHNDHQMKNKKKKKEKEDEGKEIRAEMSERGKEDKEEDEHPPIKRQRFRSLASIYKVTEPISDGHHGSRKKQRRQRGKKKRLGD